MLQLYQDAMTIVRNYGKPDPWIRITLGLTLCQTQISPVIFLIKLI